MLKKFANPTWAMLEYSWTPLLLFLTTPWFLQRLGTVQYGHWMMLAATVSLGNVLASGTGTATIKAVSARFDRPGSEGVQRVIKNAVALAIVGGGVFALLVMSVFWYGGSQLLAKMGDLHLIRLTGVVAGVLLWIEQIDNAISSAIKGASYFRAAAEIEIASKTVQILFGAFTLMSFPSLNGLYSSLILVAICRLIAKATLAKRLLRLTELSPAFEGSLQMLHFAKWGWLLGAGSVLFSVADRMLIGSMLGATALTYYSIASQLAMQVHAIAAAGLSVIFPSVSRYSERDQKLSIRRMAGIASGANFLLSSIIALILIVLSPLVLQKLVDSSTATHTAQILPWLIIAYWILAINVVPYYVLLGMGRIRLIGITVVLAGFAASASLYLVLPRYGIQASPTGRIIYSVISLVLILPVVRHLSRRDLIEREKPSFNM